MWLIVLLINVVGTVKSFIEGRYRDACRFQSQGTIWDFRLVPSIADKTSTKWYSNLHYYGFIRRRPLGDIGVSEHKSAHA